MRYAKLHVLKTPLLRIFTPCQLCDVLQEADGRISEAAGEHNTKLCAPVVLVWQVLIEERDEAIQEISQQIGEVHEIFQVWTCVVPTC
jgi:hypothetical protein